MSDKLLEAIDLFRLRIKDTDVTAKPVKEGEVNRYDPKSHEASLPLGNNAYERTVRLHEALHAIYSSGRAPKTVVGQTAEDLRLHLNHANLEGQARRDEIAAAVKDLRSIAGLPPKDDEARWRMRNMEDDLVGVFMRGVAILQGYSAWTPSSRAGRYTRLIKQAYSKIDCPHKAKLGRSLKHAFQNLKEEDSTAKAAAIIRKHFNRPNDFPYTGTYTGSICPIPNGIGLNNPLISINRAKDSDSFIFGGDSEYSKITGIKVTKQMGDVLTTANIKGLEDMAKRGEVPVVRTHRLSLTHPKKSTKGPITVMTFSGAKIRAKRLAAAMTSPSPIRLFKRRRINTEGGVGGTILIDASGSMRITNDQLDKLMELCPMGSVAYYDGVSDDSDVSAARAGGDLVIVAERGKQADLAACYKSGVIPGRTGGNQIDLQAMQWMMTQPKPWYFLTDAGFTGGCEYIARQMLHNLLGRKMVRQVRSVREMYTILKTLAVHIDGQHVVSE